eukprot:Gb_17327 [translate_table: standard]
MPACICSFSIVTSSCQSASATIHITSFRAFDKIYNEHLDGVRPGGERVYNVFDIQLPAALKRLSFEKQISMENVQKIIREADGYQPHLIAPEQGYRRLIESSLNTIRGPAVSVVNAILLLFYLSFILEKLTSISLNGTLTIVIGVIRQTYQYSQIKVHSILKDLVYMAVNEIVELKQYPSLRVAVGNAALHALEKLCDESREFTIKLVEMESTYLSVDFFRNLPQDLEKGGNPSHSLFDRYSDPYLRRIGSNVSAYVNMVCSNLRNAIPKAVVYCQVREAKRSLLHHFFTELTKMEKCVSASNKKLVAAENIIASCSLHTQLLNLKGKQLSTLLDEDPAVVERRAALEKRLQLLSNAQEEINAVAYEK